MSHLKMSEMPLFGYQSERSHKEREHEVAEERGWTYWSEALNRQNM